MSTNFRNAVSAASILCIALATQGLAQSNGHSVRQVSQACGTTQQTSTAANQTQEIVFVDGTSVIVAPGGEVTTSCTTDGGIVVQITRGLVRISGGASNNQTPIRISTPQSTMRLTAGAAIIDATGGETRAHLVNGEELVITSGGVRRRLYRPGFQVVADGSGASRPSRMSQQQIIADIQRLSPGLASASEGPSNLDDATSSTSGSDVSDSGGSGGETFAQAPIDNQDDDAGGGNGDNGGSGGVNGGGIVETPIDGGGPINGGGNTDIAFDVGGELGLSNIPSTVGDPVDAVTESSTATVDGNHAFQRQNAADYGFPSSGSFNAFETNIYFGPTTNILFSNNELSLPISASARPGRIDDDIGYYYGTVGTGIFGASSLSLYYDQGLIRFPEFPEGSFRDLGSFYGSAEFGAGTTFGPPTPNSPIFDGPVFDGVWHIGTGVVAKGLNYGTNYDRPFVDADGQETIPSVPVDLPYDYEARGDTFILVDMELLRSVNWLGQSCGDCDAAFAADIEAVRASLTNGVIEQTVTPNSNGVGAALIRTDDVSGRFVFATGTLDALANNPNQGSRLDTFHISAGFSGPILNFPNNDPGIVPGVFAPSGERAFLRAETWVDLAPPSLGYNLSISDLSQTGFYVAYPDADLLAVGAASPKIFYVDAGMVRDGDRQISTISASIGEVRIRNVDEKNLYPDVDVTSRTDAILEFSTVGTSRGLDADGNSASSIALYSDYESTAAGGGNPRLNRDGALGFFVVQNEGVISDDVEARGPLNGGTEDALGSDDPTSFANLQLGTAIETETIGVANNALTDFVGYAAGLTESDGTNGVAVLGALGAPDGVNRLDPTSVLAPNLAFSNFNNDERSFEAVLEGISFGGSGGESVYIDDNTYGAISTSPNTAMALVSGGSVVNEIAPGIAAKTSGYQHVKWGFFFGDSQTGAGQQHVHMGSYASGLSLNGMADQITSTSEVTYDGHVVANVTNGSSVYTATGTYNDTFNFGTRQGFATVGLDGNTVSGTSRSLPGTVNYTSSLSGAGLQGELNGQFVGPISSGAPAGVVGALSLTDGAGYGAVGTFAGEAQ